MKNYWLDKIKEEQEKQQKKTDEDQSEWIRRLMTSHWYSAINNLSFNSPKSNKNKP